MALKLLKNLRGVKNACNAHDKKNCAMLTKHNWRHGASRNHISLVQPTKRAPWRLRGTCLSTGGRAKTGERCFYKGSQRELTAVPPKPMYRQPAIVLYEVATARPKRYMLVQSRHG